MKLITKEGKVAPRTHYGIVARFEFESQLSSLEYNLYTSAEHPEMDDDIVRYSKET